MLFNGLNPSFVMDNKLFWKTVKPFFFLIRRIMELILMVEKEEVLQNSSKFAKKLNEFFKIAVFVLGITGNYLIK